MPVSKKLKEDFANATSYEEIKDVLQNLPGKCPPIALCLAFEKLFIDETNGFSRAVPVDELVQLHPSFRTTNGMAWCRSDTSYLGKKYVIIRTLDKGQVYSVKADGFKKAIHSSNIRADIVKIISERNCAILDVKAQIECDHKDGMKNDLTVADTKSQSAEDFQALSKAANDAKRTHCGRCKKSGKRFDARRLGYRVSFTHGDENTKVCQGCYWYDPKKFNAEISASFEKKD